MTRVKICGITNLEDALHAVRCGADALGFIFLENTPRFIGRNSDALDVTLQIPPFISRVAVRRDLGIYEERWEQRFDTVQYFENSLGTRFPQGRRLIRVLRLRDQDTLSELSEAESEADAVLLDAYHPDKLGGAGITANWELAAEAVGRLTKPAILAGGLTPENVQDAIAAVRPYAVDVSSGVEAGPGRKDAEKVRRFIEAVREFDRRNPA
jgi:phosphoribosylanthranilate isomerase